MSPYICETKAARHARKKLHERGLCQEGMAFPGIMGEGSQIRKGHAKGGVVIPSPTATVSPSRPRLPVMAGYQLVKRRRATRQGPMGWNGDKVRLDDMARHYETPWDGDLEGVGRFKSWATRT